MQPSNVTDRYTLYATKETITQCGKRTCFCPEAHCFHYLYDGEDLQRICTQHAKDEYGLDDDGDWCPLGQVGDNDLVCVWAVVEIPQQGQQADHTGQENHRGMEVRRKIVPITSHAGLYGQNLMTQGKQIEC